MNRSTIIQIFVSLLSFPESGRVRLRPKAKQTLRQTLDELADRPEERRALVRELTALTRHLREKQGAPVVACALLDMLEDALRPGETERGRSLLSVRCR